MKRWTFLSVCVIGLATIALMLILATTSLGHEPLAGFKPATLEAQQDPPTVVAVTPSEAPNNLDTTITITNLRR